MGAFVAQEAARPNAMSASAAKTIWRAADDGYLGNCRRDMLNPYFLFRRQSAAAVAKPPAFSGNASNHTIQRHGWKASEAGSVASPHSF